MDISFLLTHNIFLTPRNWDEQRPFLEIPNQGIALKQPLIPDQEFGKVFQIKVTCCWEGHKKYLESYS